LTVAAVASSTSIVCIFICYRGLPIMQRTPMNPRRKKTIPGNFLKPHLSPEW
jgi:hypothetical protein